MHLKKRMKKLLPQKAPLENNNNDENVVIAQKKLHGQGKSNKNGRKRSVKVFVRRLLVMVRGLCKILAELSDLDSSS